MKTTTTRMIAVLMLAALGLGATGCSTIDGGGAPARAGTEAHKSALLGRADFYADWYDPGAVVLPPPPAGR